MAASSENKFPCPQCPLRRIIWLMSNPVLTPKWLTDFDHISQHAISWIETVNECTSLPVLRLLVERGFIRSGEEEIHHPAEQFPLFRYFIGPSHLRGHLLYLLSLEGGMNINFPDGKGSTALLEYLYYQISDMDVYNHDEDEDILEIDEDWPVVLEGLEFLLGLGADPLLADKSGRSALSYVEEMRGLSSSKKTDLLALLRRYA